MKLVFGIGLRIVSVEADLVMQGRSERVVLRRMLLVLALHGEFRG